MPLISLIGRERTQLESLALPSRGEKKDYGNFIPNYFIPLVNSWPN